MIQRAGKSGKASSMIRILIADDHTILREGLKRIVAETEDIVVVAEAATGEEAVAKARECEPDVVVLDLSMPGRGGLEALTELKRFLPRIRVLILSVHPEDQLGLRCLRHGADGYLTKAGAPTDLIQALRRIHAGGKFITSRLAERMAELVVEDLDRPPHHRLSNRELEVTFLIAAGKTVGEIAESMHLSVKTISTYRSRILQKLGLRNNAEIMRYAAQNSLLGD